MALRSLMETVACGHLIQRRKYAKEEDLAKMYEYSQVLFGKLQAMRHSLTNDR